MFFLYCRFRYVMVILEAIINEVKGILVFLFNVSVLKDVFKKVKDWIYKVEIV